MGEQTFRRAMAATFDVIAGSRPAFTTCLAATASRLRVLAYHRIPSMGAFDEQMAFVASEFKPVSASRVVDAVTNGRSLPLRAVWVTLDDGHPSVIENGLPVLKRWRVPATLFVCPGVIGTREPFWWDVAEQAVTLGLVERPLLSVLGWLKQIPDRDRRAIVESWKDRIEATTEVPSTRQLTDLDLAAFVEGGGDIGNHTWDHPLLNQCSDKEQEQQVIAAHHWLRERGYTSPVFAYPNGNTAPRTFQILKHLGYRVAVLFDHRLATTAGDALAISRLRVNANARPNRFRSILSGLHPAIHRARERHSRSLVLPEPSAY